MSNPSPALDLFQEVVREIPPPVVASKLGLHHNTVNRWIDTQKVPEHYRGDLLRILGKDGIAEDQFYTRSEAARRCYETFLGVAESLQVDLSQYCFIEPSAGCGGFYRLLPEHRRIGIDLDPRHEGLISRDYLLWEPEDKRKYIVIGNPPFGLRGHLALQFINHSIDFADMVAFILPQLFESDGKGVPSKRVNPRYMLAHSEKLPADSFEKPDGSPVNISTIFQVWTKVNKKLVGLERRKTCKSYLRIFSLSDGGTPSSTRNKDMIGQCDVYLPSTCFSGMRAYESFEELPNKRGYGIVILRAHKTVRNILMSHDWEKIAFPSTNGALNLRRSLINDVLIEKGCHD